MKATLTNVQSATILRPATGFIKQYDYTINPYMGCGFGCEYCYARFFASDVEQSTWGQWVKNKANAASVLRLELLKGMVKPEQTTIYMAPVTDPYQPVEAKTGTTRSILEALLPYQPRLVIQTRSPIVTRDIDLLRQFKHLRVNMTINTDDDSVKIDYEPNTPSILARLRAIHKVSQAGISIGVSIAPMLPIKDIESFAEVLAMLRAKEYVTQYFHLPRNGGKQAQTSKEAIAHAVSDGLTEDQYVKNARIIQKWLTTINKRLLEGDQGFAPE